MFTTSLTLCVHHFQRADIFDLVDDLVLLARDGFPVYCGATAKAAAYFDSAGFHCPPKVNPADFFIDMITEHRETLIEAWNTREKIVVEERLHEEATVICDLARSELLESMAKVKSKLKELTEWKIKAEVLKESCLDDMPEHHIIPFLSVEVDEQVICVSLQPVLLDSDPDGSRSSTVISSRPSSSSSVSCEDERTSSSRRPTADSEASATVHAYVVCMRINLCTDAHTDEEPAFGLVRLSSLKIENRFANYERPLSPGCCDQFNAYFNRGLSQMFLGSSALFMNWTLVALLGGGVGLMVTLPPPSNLDQQQRIFHEVQTKLFAYLM